MFKAHSKNKRFFSHLHIAAHPEPLNTCGEFERLDALLSQYQHGGEAHDLEQQIQQQLALIGSLKSSRGNL